QPAHPCLSPAARRFPAVHLGVYRAVCPGAVVGGQYHHAVAGTGRWLRYPGISDGPGDLRALELYLCQPVRLGAWTVLRLALPVRCATGPGRLAGPETAPAPMENSGAAAPPSAVDQVRDSAGPAGQRPAVADPGRALGRGRAVQDHHHPVPDPQLALRRLCLAVTRAGPVHPQVLLPLPVPAGCRAGGTRQAAPVLLAEAH